MELLEFKNRFLAMLPEGKTIEQALLDVVLSHDTDFYTRYRESFGTGQDWIREFYQYYHADREGLKQDYTPDSLAKLVAALSRGTVTDLCAGSGSLTMKTAVKTSTIELDPGVLPFQLFNLALRNRTATVCLGDALTGECQAVYVLAEHESGFSTVKLADSPADLQAQTVISNPPFNLSLSYREARTGNFSFILRALDLCSDRAVLILPCSVLSESRDKAVLKTLVDAGHFEAVIRMPGNMFASTSIPTCVLVLNKQPQEHCIMVDAEQVAEKETRAQNGQYGGSSHTKRVYTKQFSVLPDSAISEIVETVDGKSEKPFTAAVSIERIVQAGYALNPSRFIQSQEEENEVSKLEWVAEQYNRIVRRKNACKLTINETLARDLHFDQETWEAAKRSSAEVADMIQKISGIKLEREDYLTFTKSRELSIRFKSKDELPAVFQQFLSLWTNNIVLLNQMENEMLAQMRDLLLPKLMSGEITL